MKIAFSVWNKRIAPVFDTSVEVVIIEVDGERVVSEKSLTQVSPAVVEKIFLLQNENVDVLVCGAVSRIVQEQLGSAGIEVLPFISGELQAVISGWMAQKLNTDAFAMPGCCGRRRGCCGTPVGEGRGRWMQRGQGHGIGRGMGKKKSV